MKKKTVELYPVSPIYKRYAYDLRITKTYFSHENELSIRFNNTLTICFNNKLTIHFSNMITIHFNNMLSIHYKYATYRYMHIFLNCINILLNSFAFIANALMLVKICMNLGNTAEFIYMYWLKACCHMS